VGLKCTGAKVNDRFVPIKHVLENGDRVEIQTTKKQRPTVEWLKYLSSPANKAKLKRALKELDNKYSDLGKDLLKGKFEKLGYKFSSDMLAKLLAYFKLDEPVELYELIGSRKLDMMKLKKAIDAIHQEAPSESIVHTEEEIPVEFPKSSRDELLIIDENISKIDFSLAKCCSPVLGDSVFGFVSVNKGVRIHKKKLSQCLRYDNPLSISYRKSKMEQERRRL